MDTYFPEDEGEETGIGGAQVDEQGAFAFQTDLQAPQGGFSFVSFPHSLLTPSELVTEQTFIDCRATCRKKAPSSRLSPLASHSLFGFQTHSLFSSLPFDSSPALEFSRLCKPNSFVGPTLRPFFPFAFHFLQFFRFLFFTPFLRSPRIIRLFPSLPKGILRCYHHHHSSKIG